MLHISWCFKHIKILAIYISLQFIDKLIYLFVLVLSITTFYQGARGGGGFRILHGLDRTPGDECNAG